MERAMNILGTVLSFIRWVISEGPESKGKTSNADFEEYQK
jgi:hypothetical protein